MCVLNFRSFLLRESDLCNVRRCRMIEQTYARVIQVSLSPSLGLLRTFLICDQIAIFSLSLHFFLSISLLISHVTRVLSSTNSRVSTRKGEISSPSPSFQLSFTKFSGSIIDTYNFFRFTFCSHFRTVYKSMS